MPEMPQLKKMPYQTTKRCAVCHPADASDPPFLECVAESVYAGFQVTRSLHCPNCSSRDTDVFDTHTGRVMLDHDMDYRAARGQAPKRGNDVG